MLVISDFDSFFLNDSFYICVIILFVIYLLVRIMVVMNSQLSIN